MLLNVSLVHQAGQQIRLEMESVSHVEDTSCTFYCDYENAYFRIFRCLMSLYRAAECFCYDAAAW